MCVRVVMTTIELIVGNSATNSKSELSKVKGVKNIPIYQNVIVEKFLLSRLTEKLGRP